MSVPVDGAAVVSVLGPSPGPLWRGGAAGAHAGSYPVGRGFESLPLNEYFSLYYDLGGGPQSIAVRG